MTDHTNFFDDLERQLIAATSDRPRRLRRARRRSLATMCTILVAVLAVLGGGVATALINSNTTTQHSAPAAPQRPQPSAPPAAATPTRGGPCGRNTRAANDVRTIDPRSIEVAVLNGTTVPGLARGVANRLQNTRWKIGTVTNAATQDHSTTEVYYGRAACRTAAILVAQAIDLIRLTDSVRPMGNGVAVVAGGSADVAVVVGSDQNQTP